MKTFRMFFFGICGCLFAAITFTACEKDNDVALKQTVDDSEIQSRGNPNHFVYPPSSHPFVQSYAEWTEDWWTWLMSFDCASNPLLDQTGENAGAGQSGPVFYLAGTAGGSVTRNVTIPKNQAILFPILNAICDYPCPPDFGFEPEEGQSLEDFLQECGAAYMDIAGNLSVTLDGIDLNDEADYRFPTDLFYFTGNPDLPNCLDPCVTGDEQPAVSDGYWMMLKKLKKGQHTLHFHGEIPDFGFVVDVTYNITVV